MFWIIWQWQWCLLTICPHCFLAISLHGNQSEACIPWGLWSWQTRTFKGVSVAYICSLWTIWKYWESILTCAEQSSGGWLEEECLTEFLWPHGFFRRLVDAEISPWRPWGSILHRSNPWDATRSSRAMICGSWMAHFRGVWRVPARMSHADGPIPNQVEPHPDSYSGLWSIPSFLSMSLCGQCMYHA